MNGEFAQQYREEASIPFEAPTFNEVERIGRYTRRWATNLPQWQQPECVAELKLRRFVDNPGYNRREGDDAAFQPRGRWRQSRVWYVVSGQQQPTGLYEELRYGYLQPPTVADSWPKPTSSTDWSSIDKEARIFQVRIYDLPGKTVTGLRDIYYILYPNVATATVREFCEQLQGRGTLTNPQFGIQAAMTGSYAFRIVKNEDQGDGSSNVIGVLLNLSITDTDFVVTLEGCGMRESIKYILNSPTLPTAGDAVFPASTSGVEYSMHFEYSREWGVFDVTISKREEKTLTAGVVTTGDNLAETVTEQSFTGVRIGNIDDKGTPVPLWTPGITETGTSVDQSISKKPNCTTDVRQKKRVAKSWLGAQVTKFLDLFKQEVSITDRNQVDKASDPVAPADGVYQETSYEQNPDKTYNNRTRTITERPVSSAVIRNLRSIFTTRTTVSSKAQDPGTDLTATVSDGTIISKTGSKTAGAKLDVEVETVVENPVSSASADNSKTVYDTRSTVTDRNQPADTSLVAPEPANGVVVVKRGEKTDGGRLNVTTDTRTERSVSAAVRDYVKTLFQIRTTVSDKSQPLDTSLDVPEPSDGIIVTKRGQKTAGALLDVDTTTTTERAVSSAEVSATKTQYEIETTQTDKAQPAGTSLTPPEAADGVVVTKRGQKTQGNRLDVTTISKQERPVSSSVVTKRLTVYESATDTENQNQPADAADPTTPGQTVTNIKTPGRQVTQKISQRTPNSVLGAETIYFSSPLTSATTTGNEGQDVPAAAPGAAPDGHIYTVTNKLGDLGKYSTSNKDQVAYPRTVHQTFYSSGRPVDVWTFRNLDLADVMAIVGGINAAASISVSKSINEFGKLDGHIHATGANSSSNGVFFNKYDNTEQEVSYSQYKGKMYKVVTTYTYDIMKDFVVSLGRAYYNGDAGHSSGKAPLSRSTFRDLGRNWYYFKKVTKIETTTTDVTSSWIGGTTITTP